MTKVFCRKAGDEPKEAYVGPYWFVRSDAGKVLLIAHRCALSDAEKYGGCLTCPHGHYDLWESWKTGSPPDGIAAMVRDAEYEEWPSGRVVYNAVHDQLIVYADRQISQYDLEYVQKHFGIPTGRADVVRDGHYQSTRSLHPR